MSGPIPSSALRVGVVISRYYPEVAQGLLDGVRAYLSEVGVELRSGDVIEAPGAFEIPLIAQRLALRPDLHGVITLGCVIKGETIHFELISGATTWGVMQAGLVAGKPIALGILTPLDEAQAIERSRPGLGNKGREAAHACVESIRALNCVTLEPRATHATQTHRHTPGPTPAV